MNELTEKKLKIHKLFQLMLNRHATREEIDNYINSNTALPDVQAHIAKLQEFKNKFKFSTIDTTILDNKLHIFIINLLRRPDRKSSISNALNDLSIRNYEFIEAVDGQELPDDIDENLYDNESAMNIHRQMSKSEIACALSHVKIAQKMIDENIQYAIVIEDDAELNVNFKRFIENFNLDLDANAFDFLILGSFSSNQFHNQKLKEKQAPYKLIEKESIIYLDNVEFSIGDVTVHKSYFPTQSLDYVHGTHAYMMSTNGAKRLIDLNYPVKVEADNIWNYFDGTKTLFTNPILVHRQHEDSDIRDDRETKVFDYKNYSESFKARISHEDFGT